MKRRSSSLALALFALLVLILIGGWLFVQHRERLRLDERLNTASKEVAARLEGTLSSHLERLMLFGSELLLEGSLDETSFRRASLAYQERHPGLQALNFVSVDGVIQWVEPLEENRQAIGFDLSGHPFAAEPLRRASTSPSVTTTPPIELLQGGWGFAAYYRLQQDGETIGFLNAVFRLRELLHASLLASEAEDFAFVLRYGEEELGALGALPREGNALPIATEPVDIGGRELALSVYALPRVVAARGTWVDEALLLSGVILAGFMAYSVRLAQRRREESELTARRLEVMIENAPDAIALLDAESGRFLSANRRAGELLELDAEELPGRDPVELAPPVQPDGRASKAAFSEALAAARSGDAPSFEWVMQKHDRSELLTEAHLVALPGQGQPLLRASFTDVTQRRHLEERLRRTQAHEAMGRLAGSVAHDFNNLLTAILGASELLRSKVAADPGAIELVDDVVRTCERAANLTSQLLAFSHNSTLAPRPVDLNTVVNGLVPMLTRLLSQDARIETGLASTYPILADSAQLELAVLNLVVNARDAMPGGGRILISTRDLEDGGVELAVEDEGEGIPDHIIDRVFDPFFTTKRPGVGTGIGLATVQEIVQTAKGRIEVESKPGRGSVFRARFPAHTEAALPTTPSRSDDESSAGGERVLVVDDYGGVRNVMRRALTSAGFEVVTAANGAEARDLFASEAPFDVLVTDVVLPDCSGVELARELRQDAPALHVLFVSGYSEEDLEEEVGRRPSATDYLTKPFSPSELVERVRKLVLASVPR